MSGSRVDFAFGAVHRLRMACQVVHKQYLAGRPLVIYTRDAQRLNAFDQLLWSFDPVAFVPHVYANDPMAAQTPIVLTTETPQPPSHPGLPEPWLLNLDLECPPNAAAFTRILEIVSEHPQDKAAARTRWQHYKAANYDVRAHDVSGTHQG
ncbi:DNA polymerase III subunit chi [Alcaligenaceae bacterium]|nr:DNA polymerase III subunit chi [Alcaligenaceae bacterium]